MQKPALVRSIYAEIRRGMPDLAAGEALELAHRFLRAYTTDPDQLKGFGQEAETRSIARLPLDEAWSDGGWRVLDYELHRSAEVEDLESDELAELLPLIAKYLGPEWQQHLLTGPP